MLENLTFCSKQLEKYDVSAWAESSKNSNRNEDAAIVIDILKVVCRWLEFPYFL